MPVTLDQVAASRPEDVCRSATAIGHEAAELSERIAGQRAIIETLRDRWQGSASEAAVREAEPTVHRMQQIHDALDRAQRVLHRGAAELSRTKASLTESVAQLTGRGWQIAPDGNVSVRPGSTLEQWATTSPATAMTLRQLAASHTTEVQTLLARFDTSDRRISQDLRGAVAGLDFAPATVGPGGAALPESPPYDDGSQIPVAEAPRQVNDWWKSLSPDERRRLLHDWPDRLGNLDGIPVDDRSTANTTIMQQDLDRPAEVAKARGVTTDEVLAHPEKYGMAGEMMNRYDNAMKVDQALTRAANRTGAPTFLQVYEPEKFGGDGRAAVAIGDPDHAPNTAVVVPGTGNDVGSGWLGSDNATDLYIEAKAADPNNPTAVVAWMGYDAPDSPLDPRIGTTALAREGGELLAADVNALNATHEGDGHMTVLGHSYGSTTVADAAAGFGMNTDDVVLVGCPGTDMAHSAADFHLDDGGHLYVGATSSDPVTHLSQIPQIPIPGTGFTAALGDDPAMGDYGSTRFKAEVPGITFPFSDHSQYYAPGSESLFSMSDIVSGHGDDLERDGMTAPHRNDVLRDLGLPTSLTDPEALRPGTSGHTHQ
ncbi:alpha/beta hydrolase [Mycolicibacterium grossiae]|uniref:alpha/beta hydrolase n=1 Tax=Mycolicibacterium grossiae TaxID=1552759 RepID=UPI000B2B6F85|nr:alpha/beta hydrolase [Mycolicibacterium grossiae]